MFGDDEDFEIMDEGNHNEGDDKFDEIVGALQDILLDTAFEKLQKDFFNGNCLQFEATEENKLVYTSIFKSYTEVIEAFILDRLNQIIEDFDMETFLKQVIERKDEIDEPLMDLLLSFSEFETFKEMMLFARAHLVATTPKLKSGKAAALGLSDKVQP